MAPNPVFSSAANWLKRNVFFPDRMKDVKNWNVQNPLGGTRDI